MMNILEAFAFLFAYFMSSFFSYFFAIDREVLRIGKAVEVKNKLLRFILLFPTSLVALKLQAKKRAKKEELNLFGIFFYLLNDAVLLGGIVLRFLPAIPCPPIEVGFGPRYRAFNINADTYNEKVPILIIWMLVSLQILIMIVRMVITLCRKKEAVKTVGVGGMIGFALVILLCLAILVWFSWLLIQ